MTDPKSPTNQRLTQIKDFLTMNKTATTIPWDPNSTIFPTRKELPEIPGAPAEAAWVWGDNDYVRQYQPSEMLWLMLMDIDRSFESTHPNTRRRCGTRDQKW